MSCIGPFIVDDVYLGDCRKLMLDIPSGVIDLIVADPPFGINYIGSRDEWWDKTNIVPYVEVPSEEYPKFTEEWIQQASRVLKRNGTMYVVSGWNHLEWVLKSIREAGLFIQSHIIWHYPRPLPTQKRFASSHYHILHTTKHQTQYVFNKVYPYSMDVWIRDKERWISSRKRPLTKLPVDIVCNMVLPSSIVGDVVLDPFMGSGTTGVVAKGYDRHFLGFEICEEALGIARERIKNTPMGIEGFFK